MSAHSPQSRTGYIGREGATITIQPYRLSNMCWLLYRITQTPIDWFATGRHWHPMCVKVPDGWTWDSVWEAATDEEKAYLCSLCYSFRAPFHWDVVRRLVGNIRRVQAAEWGRVYFAEFSGMVKVGFSSCPSRRARQLGARLIVAIKGDRRLEREWHKRFSAWAVEGKPEWFNASPEIMRAIDTIREGVPA